jgi:hypothetical protein
MKKCLIRCFSHRRWRRFGAFICICIFVYSTLSSEASEQGQGAANCVHVCTQSEDSSFLRRKKRIG